MMKQLLIIGTGGFIGAVLRFVVARWVQTLTGSHFPYGTLTVNLIGSFVLGLIAGLAEIHIVSPMVRMFIGIGILGAFTTFSTLTYETMMLLKSGSYWEAVLNMIVSMILGLVFVFVGYISGQVVH